LKTQIRHDDPDLKTPPMKGQGSALMRRTNESAREG
jgi:hypothetical protein